MCSMVNGQSKRFSFSLRIRIVGTLSLVPPPEPLHIANDGTEGVLPNSRCDVTERRFPPPWFVEEQFRVFRRARP
jgi:hypothetical protein